MRYTKLGVVDEVFNLAGVIIGVACLAVIGTYTYNSYVEYKPDNLNIKSSKKLVPVSVTGFNIVTTSGVVTLEQKLEEPYDTNDLYYFELSNHMDHVCKGNSFNRENCIKVAGWKPNVPNETKIQLKNTTKKIDILSIKGKNITTGEGVYKLKSTLPPFTSEHNVFITHIVLDDFMCISEGYTTTLSQCRIINSFVKNR